MTDTGQIPPTATQAPSRKGGNTTPNPEQTPTPTPVDKEAVTLIENVVIKKLSIKLEKLIREVKLEAEIIRIDLPKQEILIRTPQGEVTIEVPPIDTTNIKLYNGQVLLLTLPAGEPPETAKIQIIPQTTIEPAIQETQKPIIPAVIPPTVPTLKAGDNIIAIVINDLNKTNEINQITKPIALLQKTSILEITPPILQNISAEHLGSVFKETNKILPLFNNKPTVQNHVNNIKPSTITPITTILNEINSPIIKNSPVQNLEHLNDRIFQFKIINITAEAKINTTDNKTNAKPLTTTLNTGVVTDYTPKNLPIITITPDSTSNIFQPDTKLVLQTNSHAPKGTIIQFTAIPITTEQYIEQLQPNPTHNITASPISSKEIESTFSFQPLMSVTWPALQETIQISNSIAPAQTVEALRNSIPSIASPAKLLPTVMFFLVALRTGSIENWLGEKHLDTLKQAGRKDLISKLSGDFSNISRQSQELVSGEWRGISIPLLHNEDIEIMQLFSKQQDSNPDDDNSSEKTTRFILNLKLSKIGKLQLDGFLRHKKTLDVFLRTAITLPSDTRQNLLKAFQTGLKQAGLESGQMLFQTNDKYWVDIKAGNKKDTKITI